ncbi:hypothetical protein EON81_28755 [bacterium]|nr:MAG: hypothetical protein EON81_28755 [bacterium]
MRNCPLRVSIFSTGLAALAVAGGVNQIPEGSKRESHANRETRKVSKTIPSPVRYEFDRNMRPGTLVKRTSGSAGQVTRTYLVVRKDGKPVGKELLQEERVEPKETVFAMGRATYRASRSGFSRGSVLTMSATGYDPTAGRGGGVHRTRTGTWPSHGQVAVDPRVIRLGSSVFVEGYGYAVATDTGGAIKGHRIDLCFPDKGSAMRYGRKRVRVHVLRAR